MEIAVQKTYRRKNVSRNQVGRLGGKQEGQAYHQHDE